MADKLTPKSRHPSDWYNEVVLRAKLADYSPVKGMMVFRPAGYALWEYIQSIVDRGIKARGVKNAYFPILIPLDFLEREKEHVEGFSPQLAVVTFAGGEKLASPLVVRPTSETVMYDTFAKWIQSYRDLPLLLNQWGSVVRWELRTYLFMRTSEFLWQEGHTAHATREEADGFARDILEMYQKELIESELALPLIPGRKSAAEKFPGADETYTMEGLMPDGKALQFGTAHNLGQNFSKPFKVKFLDKDGRQEYVWQTSWAVSSRLIGALVLVHGDDKGLVLPSKMAPTQVMIVPIQTGEKEVVEAAQKLIEELKGTGIRADIDRREEYTPGWKFNEYELQGVPIRLELGKNELEKRQVTIVRRDTGEKQIVSQAELIKKMPEILRDMQKDMYAKAKKFMEDNTHEATDMKDFAKIMAERRGFIRAYWCGDPKEEKEVKEKTKATARVLPFTDEKKSGRCFICGREATGRWIWGQSY
jgi:prolyl-tRNA synthetase